MQGDAARGSSCRCPKSPVRRTVAAARGHAIDLRATLRGMTGAGGRRRAAARSARAGAGTPPLVVLCDISGSMDRYARMLLHFLHAITNDRHRVHVLTFGTRLTNITRHLKHRDVDVALARVDRRPSPTGRAARASARASPSSTGAGRGACSGRTRSCC